MANFWTGFVVTRSRQMRVQNAIDSETGAEYVRNLHPTWTCLRAHARSAMAIIDQHRRHFRGKCYQQNTRLMHLIMTKEKILLILVLCYFFITNWKFDQLLHDTVTAIQFPLRKLGSWKPIEDKSYLQLINDVIFARKPYILRMNRKLFIAASLPLIQRKCKLSLMVISWN